MAEFEASPLSIDLDRIAAVCEEEWAAFLSDMDIEPVPERQDFRGFLLNWVAVFAPEAFPPSLSDQMVDWMENGLAAGRWEWRTVKRPFIGATLFALTGNTRWLRIQFNNFDNGGSQLRTFYHRTLALIAPSLTFDEDLIDSAGGRFEKSLLCDVAAAGALCRVSGRRGLQDREPHGMEGSLPDERCRSGNGRLFSQQSARA